MTLRGRSRTTTTHGESIAIASAAPPPLAIISARFRQLTRLTSSNDPNQPWWWESSTYDTDLSGRTTRTGWCPPPSGAYEGCGSYHVNPGYGFRYPRRAMIWAVMCTDKTPNPCPNTASVTIFDAVFQIDDPTSPQLASAPNGAIFAGATGLSGLQTVSVDASDAGSGVFRASLEVDRNEVATSNSNSVEYPTCVKPFRVTQPCPERVVTGLSVDTTQLADGEHEAILRVYDATENNFTSYGPVKFSTTNSRLANYCESDLGLGMHSNLPAKPLRFGQVWNLRARLSDARSWDVSLLEGTRKIAVIASGTASDDGRISFKVPAGTNRTLRLAARPPGSRERYRCSGARSLRVRPKLHIVLTPEEVSNGRSVRLRGRLLGRANTGRAIVIQARATGSRRWATVRVVRTNRHGRFGMEYRFLSTYRTVTYAFRARIEAGRGYPYAGGSSHLRRVRVYGA